jgi:hypothetical protein
LSAPVEGGGGRGGAVEGGFTVIAACADFVVSAMLLAVTVAVVVALTLGAVNSPLLETLPMFADQVTDVFEVLVTVATNCCVPTDWMLAETGDTETLTVADGFTVTLACADFVVSATLVAFTVIVVVVVTLGAVNKPLLEIVPPVAAQVTLVFDVLLTMAPNCCVPAD